MNTKTPLRRTLSAFRRPVAAVSAVAGLLAMMPGVANAQVAFYSSRASFNVVAPACRSMISRAITPSHPTRTTRPTTPGP
jgi:hypothetical protein